MQRGVRDIAPKPAGSSSAPPPTPSPAPPTPPSPPRPPSQTSSSGPVPTLSRKRGAITAIACVSCRRKKRKCNGSRPTCDSCHALKLACTYEISPNERFQSDLRQKVRDLERELSQLKTALGPPASEVSSEDRDAVIRTARQLHLQQQHQQRHPSRLMEGPLDHLPEGGTPASMGMSNVAMGTPTMHQGASGLMGGDGTQHGLSSSTSMIVSPPSMLTHQDSIMSGMSGMTSLTDDSRSQGRSQAQSSTEWLSGSSLQEYSMYFGIEDQMSQFSDPSMHRGQGMSMPFATPSAPMQLRDYQHEASRLGEYIEYIGAPGQGQQPPSSSGPSKTYAPTTPHPRAYQIVKVPTYTLQPADTEHFSPHELDPTRHLSHQWILFRDKCRSTIAQGIATADEILGTTDHVVVDGENEVLSDGDMSQHLGADDVDVDLTVLFSPPKLSTAVTIFSWCAAFVAKAERVRPLPLGLRLATVYLAVLMLRWEVSPTKSNYRALPEWLRPIPSQIFDGHCAAIDIIPWPLVREGFTRNPQDFVEILTMHTQFDWFWSDIDCFTSAGPPMTSTVQQRQDHIACGSPAPGRSHMDMSRGKRRAADGLAGGGLRGRSVGGAQTRVSPLFKSHVADLRHWVLDSRILLRFPEFEGRAYFRNNIVSNSGVGAVGGGGAG